MKYLHVFIIIICYIAFGYSQENSSVQLSQINSNLYKVTYNVGYLVNGILSIGEDGLLLVDTGGKATEVELKRQIEMLGYDKPTIIINTHDHIDHTGGNATFGSDPLIIAHKNLRHRLQHGTYIIQDYPDEALPDITIDNSMSLFFNGEEIRIIALPGSHTDSDIIVHFTRSDIAYLGDLAYGMSFPSVDYRTGNDAKYAEVIDKAISLLPDNTKIISGHGRDCTMDDMIKFQQMLEKTTEIVREGLAKGLSVESMQKNNILNNWTSFSRAGYVTTDLWISDLASDILDPAPKKSIIEPILIALNENGPEAGVSEYYNLKNNHITEYHFHEYRLYQLARYLIDKARYIDAITLLDLNATEYPKFWMTYDGLGEAYLKTGNTKEAIKNYEAVLLLDSENVKAVNQLELLGVR